MDRSLQFLLGKDIFVKGVGTVRQIHLDSIASPEEQERYTRCLSLIAQSTDDIIALYEAQDEFDRMPYEERAKINSFDLIVSVRWTRELLLEALDFFIVQHVSFDEASGTFIVSGGETDGVVDHDTYPELRRTIMQMNYLEVEQASNEHKFANKRAQAIFEKLQAGRKKMKKAIPKSAYPSLSNIVSAVCVQHNSYNLQNIGDLTIYQLYDQFTRLNTKTQIDIYSLKWAAWGTDPFDFSLWYRNKKEG